MILMISAPVLIVWSHHLFITTDECYAVQHNSRGIVGMANCGHNTNSSQFYITLKPTPWMDTVYVAFG